MCFSVYCGWREWNSTSSASGRSEPRKTQFVGDLVSREESNIVVDVENRFSVGGEIELMTPGGNITFMLINLLSQNKTPIDVAPGSGHVVE
jgi:putative protease